MEGVSQNDITAFARTNWRKEGRVFGIRQADRRHHMYVIGKTGTGKTTLLKTMIRQDIEAGRGLAVFDPHGDLVDELVTMVPSERGDDLVYFNVPDPSSILGYNPLANVPPEKRSLVASGVLEAFRKLWVDSWGPRLEHLLRSALLALVEIPGATLEDVLRLLEDRMYRRWVAEHIENRRVREVWLREYERYPERLRGEAAAPIQNKVGAFLADPVIRAILTERRERLDLRKIMDKGGILLVNLAKGKIGEDSASLLGALLVSGIEVAAHSRAEQPEKLRRDFYLYLDEFHCYSTFSLASMLSELRKCRVSLILANQYLTQLDERVRDAILGNAGTIIAFRVGVWDAEILEKEFWPEFRKSDLVQLPNYEIYLRLMIEGRVSRPFSAGTLAERNPNC